MGTSLAARCVHVHAQQTTTRCFLCAQSKRNIAVQCRFGTQTDCLPITNERKSIAERMQREILQQ
jgi:hypothetical protein